MAYPLQATEINPEQVINEPASIGRNRCDHLKDSPTWILRNNPYETKSKTDDFGFKRRPKLLYKAAEKFRRYYENPSMFPMLNNLVNNSKNQRSERREAIVKLMEVILLNMEVKSFRVGYFCSYRNEFVYRSLKWLAEKAGISYARAKRAWKDLRSVGIVSRKKIAHKQEDGSFRSPAYAKWICGEGLFAVLRLNKWLARERIGTKEKKQSAEEAGHSKLILNALGNQMEQQEEAVKHTKKKAPEDCRSWADVRGQLD